MNEREQLLEYIKEDNLESFSSFIDTCLNELNTTFYLCLSCNAINCFKLFFNSIDFSKYENKENYFLNQCILNNHCEFLKVVLTNKNIDLSYNNNFCIQSSVEYGYFDIFKILLNDSRIDPSINKNKLIYIAQLSGEYEMAKLIFKHKKVQETLEKDRKSLYDFYSKKILNDSLIAF